MIFISTICWYEVEDLVQFQSIQELLGNIDPLNYSEQVTGINFIYIAVQSDNIIHEEEFEYDSTHGDINIRLKLDYDQLKDANEERALELMKNLFLESINRFEELEIEFEIEQFKRDVRDLFYPEMVISSN